MFSLSQPAPVAAFLFLSLTPFPGLLLLAARSSSIHSGRSLPARGDALLELTSSPPSPLSAALSKYNFVRFSAGCICLLSAPILLLQLSVCMSCGSSEDRHTSQAAPRCKSKVVQVLARGVRSLRHRGVPVLRRSHTLLAAPESTVISTSSQISSTLFQLSHFPRCSNFGISQRFESMALPRRARWVFRVNSMLAIEISFCAHFTSSLDSSCINVKSVRRVALHEFGPRPSASCASICSRTLQLGLQPRPLRPPSISICTLFTACMSLLCNFTVSFIEFPEVFKFTAPVSSLSINRLSARSPSI